MARKQKSSGNRGLGKWLWIGLAVLFVGSIVWSFVYETLMPILAQGDTGAAVRNLVGFPIILAGTALFAYGGLVFVRDTFSAMQDPQMAANLAHIKDDEAPGEVVRRARWKNTRLLFSSWKDGTLRMALGFGLIAIGGWLINL